MKKVIYFIVALSFYAHYLSSQIGINGAMQTFNADGWHDYAAAQIGSQSNDGKGFSFGIDYWFRLKSRRVEFMPEINYGKYDRTTVTTKFEHRMVSFFFNTNLYLLDFKNDCNCPTWSKTGNFFTKGFFIQISPGIARMTNRLENSLKVEDETFAWAIGGGAGVDIGLSDFLTITPMFRFHYYPKATWENLIAPLTEPSEKDSSVRVLGGGIRVGLRTKKSR